METRQPWLIGERLIEDGIFTREQVEEARFAAEQDDRFPLEVLEETEPLPGKRLMPFLCGLFSVEAVDLWPIVPAAEALKLVPAELARRHLVVPIEKDTEKGELWLAMADPSNIYAQDDLKFLTGFNVKPMLATYGAIRAKLAECYSEEYESELVLNFDAEGDFFDGESQVPPENPERQSSEAPVVRFVNLILVDAERRGADEIHLEPYEKEFRVRYRLDGVLREVMKPPTRLKTALVARIKIMAELDIAERRLPQRGKISLVLGANKYVDYDVSVVPVLFGEKVVLKIRNKEKSIADISKLGLSKAQIAILTKALKKPGLILIAGPHGSGKHTFLNCLAQNLVTDSANVVVIDRPRDLENLSGVNEVMVDEPIGFGFAEALRAVVDGQGADHILVADLADPKTMKTAFQAVFSGQRVIGLVAVANAAQAIEFAHSVVDPAAAKRVLNLIVGAQLARVNCPHCHIDEEVNLENAMEDVRKLFRSPGCEKCYQTGYLGRIGVFEFIPLTETKTIEQTLLELSGKGIISHEEFTRLTL